jgi:hypothetical protein
MSRLTVKRIRDRTNEPGRYHDGDGLYLQVKTSAKHVTSGVNLS